MKKTCLLILAVLFVPAAGAAFRCVDEKGNTHVGDTPPEACASVTMYEVSKTGTVLKKIDPTPSADEVRRRQEEAMRKREADKAAAEQRRRDTALLDSFSAEREFDVVRDRTLDPIRARVRLATERLGEIDKRQKQIDEEMEFYKAGKRKAAGKAVEAPPMLVAEMDRLNNEKKTLAASIAASEREMVRIRERFDSDRKRWVALKASAGRAAPAKTVDVVPAGETKAVRK